MVDPAEEPDEENPEWSDADFAAARPMAESNPELFAQAVCPQNANRVGPPADKPKVLVSLRLDADLVEALRGRGEGWQPYINATLRRSIGL